MGTGYHAEVIRPPPLDALSVMILGDDVTDRLVVDEGVARRPAVLSRPAARVPSVVMEGGEAIEGLRPSTASRR